MERSREPVLQALQQSPSVIFSPVAMRALRLGGGPRAYSYPPLVAACEPNDAAGLEQIGADAGSPGQGRAMSDARRSERRRRASIAGSRVREEGEVNGGDNRPHKGPRNFAEKAPP